MKTTKNWRRTSGRKTMLLAGMAVNAMLVAVLAFGLVLTGCPTDADDVKEEARTDPVLGETFEIKGTIYGELWSDSGVSYTPLTNVTTVTVSGPFSTAPTATVTGGSNFSVTIPTAVSYQLQTATKELLRMQFDLSNSEKITTLQPADAKFGRLELSATAPGYSTYFRLGIASGSGTEENYTESSTRYSYVYVDKDVTIKGSDRIQGEPVENGVTYAYDDSITVDLSLKAGWNVVERSNSDSGKKISATREESKGTTTYSVKGVRESAKWSLYPREN
ncbi:hypothetical protein AGMMS50267_09440 [Spirochaetia bacterium]|nr:hypothetical protein AGMMS50267_09440 [Spirochaetia bacterium]